MAKVITANVLSTGTVVLLGIGRRWVREIGDAVTYSDDAAATGDLDWAKQDADKAVVVDPFVTDVTDGSDGKRSMSLRDRIRAFGPTIQFLPAGESGVGGA